MVPPLHDGHPGDGRIAPPALPLSAGSDSQNDCVGTFNPAALAMVPAMPFPGNPPAAAVAATLMVTVPVCVGAVP
jgi:hypothetical protein